MRYHSLTMATIMTLASTLIVVASYGVTRAFSITLGNIAMLPLAQLKVVGINYSSFPPSLFILYIF